MSDPFPVFVARSTGGVVAALAISMLAAAAGALSRSGVIAATLLGAVAVAAGWDWGVLLVVYFVASSALSHWHARTKAERTAAIVAKDGQRDARQVLANGGVFAVAALAVIVTDHVAWWAVAGGALAASTADTWATEIGTMWGGPPRSIMTWKRVPPGTSGGMTVAGTLGSFAGSAFIALLALLLGWHGTAGAIVTGGVAGALADSLLGATVQERRWCDACGEATERAVHRCGHMTRRAGGIPRLDNDAVNFLCTLCGAAVAALAWRLG